MIPSELLTQKEIEIAALVFRGRTNPDIANHIGTTEQMVKNHLRRVFDKHGVWNRLELAVYVAQHGGPNWPQDTTLSGVS